MTARLRAPRFDRALAVGVPAPVGGALAAHAARLTSVAERQAVARALRRAVATRTTTPRDTVRARADAPGQHRLGRGADRCGDTATACAQPVGARGMARLRQLLSDGTGPLYRYGRGDLAGRLGAALAAL